MQSRLCGPAPVDWQFLRKMKLCESTWGILCNITASRHQGGYGDTFEFQSKLWCFQFELWLRIWFVLGKRQFTTHFHTLTGAHRISFHTWSSAIFIVEIIAVFAVSHTRVCVCVVWCVCVQGIKLVSRGRECWVMRSEQTQQWLVLTWTVSDDDATHTDNMCQHFYINVVHDRTGTRINWFDTHRTHTHTHATNNIPQHS